MTEGNPFRDASMPAVDFLDKQNFIYHLCLLTNIELVLITVYCGFLFIEIALIMCQNKKLNGE